MSWIMVCSPSTLSLPRYCLTGPSPGLQCRSDVICGGLIDSGWSQSSPVLGESDWETYFVNNLRRKAETLDLDPDVKLEMLARVGRKRSLAAGRGAKIGAEVNLRLPGSPTTLQVLWSWGLGTSNSAGFGVIAE